MEKFKNTNLKVDPNFTRIEVETKKGKKLLKVVPHNKLSEELTNNIFEDKYYICFISDEREVFTPTKLKYYSIQILY